MATVRKRGDKWQVQITLNGHRKSKTFQTKLQASAWARETEQDLSLVGDNVDLRATFDDLLNRYANEVSPTKGGAEWEKARIEKFRALPMAEKRLVELKREDFESYIEERLKTVQSSTVNRELNFLRHTLTQARRWNLMDHNPFRDLKCPSNPPHRERLFEPEEIEALLIPLSYSEEWDVTMQRQRVAVALLFAFETAMRAGEICGIRLADIDFKKRTVFLPRTKNGHPRTVPLSTEAVRLLKRLEPFPKGDPVFRLSSGTLSTIFRKARHLAGLDDLTFHDSRHEGTTRLAQKLEVMDLARVTGHKDIRQLMTYYNKKAHHIAKLLD